MWKQNAINYSVFFLNKHALIGILNESWKSVSDRNPDPEFYSARLFDFSEADRVSLKAIYMRRTNHEITKTMWMTITITMTITKHVWNIELRLTYSEQTLCSWVFILSEWFFPIPLPALILEHQGGPWIYPRKLRRNIAYASRVCRKYIRLN